MEVVVRQAGTAENVCVVSIKGRLDASVADEFGAAIDRAIQTQPSHILFNFAGVSFMSSSAFRVLLAALKKVKAGAGQLRLAEMNAHLEETFKLTGFDALFEVFSDEAEALKGW